MEEVPLRILDSAHPACARCPGSIHPDPPPSLLTRTTIPAAECIALWRRGLKVRSDVGAAPVTVFAQYLCDGHAREEYLNADVVVRLELSVP